MSGSPSTDVETAGCCIVGGGPAGMVLGLLLARRGVDTVLLEAHRDFDREFRGDTLHPSVMEIMDELGLAERLLEIPHGTMSTMTFHTPEGDVPVGDLRRVSTRFPFVTMLPQARLLEVVADEAGKHACFRRVMGANVREVIVEEGEVRGVRYRDGDDRLREVRAPLTVAADGRFSRVRQALGLTTVRTGPPIDVLWIRLPRLDGDPPEAGGGYLGPGRYMIVLSRGDQWQVGYIVPKGTYQTLRAEGLGALRQSIAGLAPWLGPNAEHLTDWRQAALLSVEASRLRCWWVPGALLIGDAAHVMSPVGGVGIGNAVEDAVEAANVLAEPLRRGRVTPADLHAVQRRREWPTRITQALQQAAYRLYIERALRARGSFHLPAWIRLLTRIPILRDVPTRLIALGVRRARVRE